MWGPAKSSVVYNTSTFRCSHSTRLALLLLVSGHLKWYCSNFLTSFSIGVGDKFKTPRRHRHPVVVAPPFYCDVGDTDRIDLGNTETGDIMKSRSAGCVFEFCGPVPPYIYSSPAYLQPMEQAVQDNDVTTLKKLIQVSACCYLYMVGLLQGSLLTLTFTM